VKKRILVVGYYSDTRDTVVSTLERLGHRVSVAYSGLHALEQIQEEQPHVIVCCAESLPFLSASQLRNELHRRGRTIPMITLHADESHTVHACARTLPLATNIAVALAA